MSLSDEGVLESSSTLFYMKKREIRVMIKSTKTNQRRISLMDYYTQKLLGLIDKNFMPDKIWL